MNLAEAISTCLRKYVDFRGVASRSEFWWWTLFTILVSIAISIADGVARTQLLANLWALAVLLPGLAVSVRRLRDGGHSWGWLFISLVPIVGTVILIVFYCQPGKSVAQQPVYGSLGAA